ncbi:MAG: tRNA pseudouridine(38-40) synthase TruA [Chitinophagaceae bacterium]|jgi:tRNA pseudouridine38-40 synthase|nr:tRNA pseudouridine(38-40) synthase TruA [Chitinophagaceae bacterium]
MPRYFLEVGYMGTRFSGFQVQDNATTVQGEVEKALATLLRTQVVLTGSSRTDAGVHAIGNYFHFDVPSALPDKLPYRLNAILPADISVTSLRRVHDQAHCRFDAISRHYRYVVYQRKNPFMNDRGWFLPYPLDADILLEAADILLQTSDFTSFAKRNAQVHTHQCTLYESRWYPTPEGWNYEVRGNRFLRGMVRGLVGTMLQAGRGRIGMSEFKAIIEAKDNTLADFTPPGKGLFLCEVRFPDRYFEQPV